MTGEDMNQAGTEELALAEATGTPGGAAPGSGATNKPVAEPPQIFTFADMKLGIGDRLQIQLPAHLQSERAFVRVVGYLENTSLIVTAPSRNGVRLELLENEVLIVRAFSRQSAFAFNCSILRVCKLPFDYLHLSFPRRIQGTVIRKSTRVRAGF
ncbi:MAG TPA: flagellar brake protein, partial [Rhodocyclaceae bacterium]|nr:flagellar brake protein [Rhodocyclaceae bacterium]